jgi:hypothetical protein
VDAVVFDAAHRWAISANGHSGDATVVALNGAGALKVVQTLKTEVGARTLALDPKTHRILLPSARFAPITTPGQRPAVVPGSLKLLVFGLN